MRTLKIVNYIFSKKTKKNIKKKVIIVNIIIAVTNIKRYTT